MIYKCVIGLPQGEGPLCCHKAVSGAACVGCPPCELPHHGQTPAAAGIVT